MIHGSASTASNWLTILSLLFELYSTVVRKVYLNSVSEIFGHQFKIKMDSAEAAKLYIEEKLEVDFVEDKSELLNKIVRAFVGKVPYQNISTSILAPEERFPTLETVVENGTSFKGGMNVHNNWFFKILLESLGYSVAFLAASVQLLSPEEPRKLGSHFGILVKDLNEPGDLHLVDVGTGQPVFKAIPLNELPYEATDVTSTYKFVEEDDQWHSEFKDSEDEIWTRYASYDKTPVEQSPDEVFKEPVLEFLREDFFVGGITAVCFPQPGSSAIPDIPDFDKDFDYWSRFDTDTIIFRNSSGFEREEEIPQDMIARTVEEYFPHIPKEDIERKIQILAGEADFISNKGE